jgi:hypothetical protein
LSTEVLSADLAAITLLIFFTSSKSPPVAGDRHASR